VNTACAIILNMGFANNNCLSDKIDRFGLNMERRFKSSVGFTPNHRSDDSSVTNEFFAALSKDWLHSIPFEPFSSLDQNIFSELLEDVASEMTRNGVNQSQTAVQLGDLVCRLLKSSVMLANAKAWTKSVGDKLDSCAALIQSSLARVLPFLIDYLDTSDAVTANQSPERHFITKLIQVIDTKIKSWKISLSPLEATKLLGVNADILSQFSQSTAKS
jgi:hypothetical protein